MIRRAAAFIDKGIHYFEVTFLTVSLSAMALILFFQVVCGWAGIALSWANEAAIYLMVLIMCVGASAATRMGRHVMIGLIADHVKGKVKRALQIIVGLICAAACAGAFAIGVNYVSETKEIGSVAVTINIPLWIIYSAVPLSAAFMSIRFLLIVISPDLCLRETEGMAGTVEGMAGEVKS